MSEKKVALILSHMAERAVPGKEINLWLALQTRLANAPLQTSTKTNVQKGPQMKTNLILSNRLRLAALLVVAIILSCGLFLTTPQGQAWAQSALRFFTNQESDALPTLNATATPTQPLLLFDRTTRTAIPAATSTPPGCDSILYAHCTIEQAQPQISFPIVQLGVLPKGMYFRGAVVESQRAVLVYNCPTGCLLLLTEEPAAEADTKEWVGATAQVKTVPIQTEKGPVNGEYVQGGFTGQAGGPAPTWDSSYPTYTLRWETSGIQYSIKWSPSPQNQAELKPNETLLVTLVESLTNPSQPAPNPNFMLSAVDSTLMAGFPVRVPSFTPKGWDQPFYSYDAATGFVCLNYATGGMRDHPRLFVRESAAAPITSLQPADPTQPGAATPSPVQYEPVAIGGADNNTGRFTSSRFNPPKNACNGQNEFFTTNEALQWRSQGITYEIYAGADSFSTHSVSKLDLQRMAESITGVTTIPAGTADPEHLWSIAEAEKLAGFTIKAPVKLPEGYTFEMARMDQSTMISMYRAPDPSPSSLDLNTKPPVIYLYQCPAQTDGQDPCTKDIQGILGEAKEPVLIHHQSGFYARGNLGADETSNWKLIWRPDHMFLTRRLYWKEGDSTFLLKLMWGGMIDREAMILMADSIK